MRASKLQGVKEKLDNLTICIITFDSAKTIVACLDQLEYQEADKLKVLIVDNGSKDGTPELLEAQIRNGWFRPPCFKPELDIRLIRLPETKGKAACVVNAMKTFQQEVTTEFMMRIDSDIMIPPNILKPMIQSFRDDPKLGMLAIGYCPTKNHVPTDCTMFKTSDVKAITWQWTQAGCDCNHAFNQLNALGKKVMFHPDLRCRHLKFL